MLVGVEYQSTVWHRLNAGRLYLTSDGRPDATEGVESKGRNRDEEA